MTKFVDIGKYWKEGDSVNKVFELTIERGEKVDRNSLTLAKKGKLRRCEISTLWNIFSLAKYLSGNKNLNLEDILKDDEER